MTAIGLLLFVVGVLVAKSGGHPLTSLNHNWANKWDIIGGTAILIGIALTTVGIVVWLWKMMP